MFQVAVCISRQRRSSKGVERRGGKVGGLSSGPVSSAGPGHAGPTIPRMRCGMPFWPCSVCLAAASEVLQGRLCGLCESFLLYLTRNIATAASDVPRWHDIFFDELDMDALCINLVSCRVAFTLLHFDF